MRKFIASILVVVFICVCNSIFSQSELQPVEDAARSLQGIFGDSDNSVSSVKLISVNERSLTVNVSYKGYKDKKYRIRGALLSRSGRTIEQIPSVEIDLPSEKKSFDISFHFKPSRNFTRTYVDSYYLILSIDEADGLLSGLDGVFDGSSISGDTYKYVLENRWRVAGNEKMIIRVTLDPIGAAKMLKN